jgi:hypothetical protein
MKDSYLRWHYSIKLKSLVQGKNNGIAQEKRMQCLRLRFTETKIKLKNDTLSLMHTGPFTTRAPKKNRKHEIAFGCVILMKKNLA